MKASKDELEHKFDDCCASCVNSMIYEYETHFAGTKSISYGLCCKLSRERFIASDDIKVLQCTDYLAIPKVYKPEPVKVIEIPTIQPEIKKTKNTLYK